MMITAFKQEIDSGGQAQADGTLAGAVFSIKDKDGNVVDTLTTDAKGKTQVAKELDVGDYSLVETKAPTGYTLNATPVKVSGS
ncbi:prealbumin-like fold domain-containing protein [Eubacterium aggregans]|uniref:prealbumin-like fold domain-containing protein n=1 Tax=Eubacterium aggregans TaxID=81409 RepID=UPI003F3AABB1